MIDMSRIKQFFTTDHVPRWQVLGIGIIAFLASLVVDEVNHQRSIHNADVRDEQHRVEAKLLEIQRHSVEFQTYAGAFVSAVLDKSSQVQSARDELIGNILAQDAAVDVSFTVFNENTKVVVSEYRAALRQMRNAIDQVDGIVSMGMFWEAAANLLEARNNLLKAIQEQANPSAS
jgi:CRISPR/Cas system-associated protein Csm6